MTRQPTPQARYDATVAHVTRMIRRAERDGRNIRGSYARHYLTTAQRIAARELAPSPYRAAAFLALTDRAAALGVTL